MDQKTFNATVCLLGVLILSIHIFNVLFKKDRRKDENSLLSFFIFTVIHFATYFAFTFIRDTVKSDTFIIGFYTLFYIMNNVELLLFYIYVTRYIDFDAKTKKILNIVNYVLFALFIISDFANIFAKFYFTSVGGVYTRTPYMIISQGYQFIMLVVVFLIVLVNKKLVFREKLAFFFYCTIPFVAIILQNNYKGYAIAYVSLLMAIEILFLFLNVEKNIKLREEEQKVKEANIKIMVSQIQPHFVYNTLSSISTLIPLNPEEAQKALDNFTDYLRVNFSALTENKLVSFEDELKHIKTYVSLEKMRFKDRLNAVYDIGVTGFAVPPLSIQPLVENAIKHGLLKKIEGGTVTIKTYETDDAYIVEVIDDGVGFNMSDPELKSNRHVGLSNIKHRIKSMTNGDISFSSEVNKGTKVTVKFYK